jgi:hypothetical protein
VPGRDYSSRSNGLLAKPSSHDPGALSHDEHDDSEFEDSEGRIARTVNTGRLAPEERAREPEEQEPNDRNRPNAEDEESG